MGGVGLASLGLQTPFGGFYTESGAECDDILVMIPLYPEAQLAVRLPGFLVDDELACMSYHGWLVWIRFFSL